MARGGSDAKRREAFLSGMATGQSASAAASASGISRASVYRWRARSARFARQWDEAVEGGADLLEKEAWRRAVEGTARPVFARGVQVGEVRQYSDRLLMFMLQARRPDVYRPRPAPGARQPDIPEDLGRRVKAARERVRNAPPPPPRDVPPRPVDDRRPDPPPRKDDDDPPSSSAAFRARYGRYPTGFEVMKLGIKCFQAVDLGLTPDHAVRQEPRSSPALLAAFLNNECLHQAEPSSSPHPELVEGRAPSPQAGKVLMSSRETCASHSTPVALHSTLLLQPPAATFLGASREGCPSFDKLRMAGSGGQAAAGERDMKPGLARTLVRLCRAGIDALLGLPRAHESGDGVSHLSHAAHRMPIPRAFWRDGHDGDQRQDETKRPPKAAFQRKTCLISGLRLPLERAVPA